MMMVFGLFVFELRTLPYQQLQLSRNWRHVKNDRVGRSAKWQYVGAGENQLTLGGLLYPEITEATCLWVRSRQWPTPG